MGQTIDVMFPGLDVGRTEADMDDSDTPILTLEQLQPDARGAVVLMNDSNLHALVVESSVAVVGRGTSGSERTLAGDNVAGLLWLRFANGVTLYYPADLVLSVRVPPT